MSAILGLGAYLPSRVVTNAELATRLGCESQWILDTSGIEERRYAEPEESVVSMGVSAAERCLERSGVKSSDLGMILVSSSSSERRFPGPASAIAHRLGIDGVPAIDLPIASAGSLFGMTLAATLSAVHGHVLVVASEKMSTIVSRAPLERGIAPLFGDGAGACVIGSVTGPGDGLVAIVDSVLHSDGAFAEDLRLEFDAPLEMNGRSVILQASRKIPAVIGELLDRNEKLASSVEVFLMHQANQNLMDRVARGLDLDSARFYSNIRRYGNTSSASMLIAAAEWWCDPGPSEGDLICFAAFGAGFHWGALLAESV
ncbi:MAG: 3-oxoacyl-ACP synthase III family protein [Bryobacteraceae bacterium]